MNKKAQWQFLGSPMLWGLVITVLGVFMMKSTGGTIGDKFNLVLAQVPIWGWGILVAFALLLVLRGSK